MHCMWEINRIRALYRSNGTEVSSSVFCLQKMWNFSSQPILCINNSPVCSNCYFVPCGKCNRKITEDESFIIEEGIPHHSHCLFDPCDRCGQPISGEIAKALGKAWHSSCFTCQKCNNKLDRTFVQQNSMMVCLKCGKIEDVTPKGNMTESIESRKCNSCHRSIDSKEASMKLIDKYWHVSCFKCSLCRKEIGAEDTVRQNPDDSIYCDRCFENSFASKCRGCGGSITGRYMDTEGKRFHPECMKCHFCDVPLGSKYYEKDGKMSCLNCGNVPCDICGKGITGSYAEILGKKIHSDCFQCHSCKRKLSSDYYEVNNHPYCEFCATNV